MATLTPAPSPAHDDAPRLAPAAATPERREARRSALVGNFVDQFDIFLPVIALGGVLSTRSTIPDGLVFAATLLGRPLGAFILGTLADRRGRARVSRGALLGLSVCTGLMVTLPLHTSTWAVAALLALRFAAGFFLGGQYSAAIPRALALTEPQRRGHLSGLVMAMPPLANATIAAATMMLTASLGGAYTTWGWRLLFVVGALLPLILALTSRSARAGPAGHRHSSHESDKRDPAAHDATDDEEERVTGRVVAALFTLMTGLWLFTMMGVSVLTSSLRPHFSPHDVGLVMLVATAVSAPTMAAAGAVSTRVGRSRFFMAFGALACIAAPAAHLVAMHAASSGSIVATTIAVAAVQIVTVSAYGPVGAYLAEHFPESRRSRGYGSVYSASIVLPGLYPFWLPTVTQWLGRSAAVPLVLCVAGLLVTLAPAWIRGSNVGGYEKVS